MSSAAKKEHAVIVQNACKYYGTKRNPNVILDGLDMTVPKGTIYGLLGASGCGKTTLLSCIVGIKSLNSGEIRVLGGTPGSRGSGVPGPRVGYMPQNVALHGELTIRETLKYFGWISNVTTEEVETKLTFYRDLLMLPHPDQMVKDLSGGQQRRVSLAAALIHDPELLLLDEPTVGVDPLLRQTIWNHLVEITKKGRTTVIVTTHYVEETRQAHLIGLMRGGVFLAEEPPESLLSQFNCTSLEDVFLKLSVIQNMGKRRRSSILLGVSDNISLPAGVVNEAIVVDDEINNEISGEFGDGMSVPNRGHRVSISPEATADALPSPAPPCEDLPPVKFIDHFKFVNFTHMKALIWKNSLWMWRNIPFMIFIVGVPIVQITIFCFAIGQPIKNLNLAIVNNELGSADGPCNFTRECNSTRLSCHYLQYVQNLSFNLHYFNDEDAGKNYVREGYAWAAVILSHNFSDGLRLRLDPNFSIKDWDLVHSAVDVYQDASDVNVAFSIKKELRSSFESFFDDLKQSCGVNQKFGQIPIRWERPIYGSDGVDYTNFVAPGFILTNLFIFGVALTSGSMIMERVEGILERSLVNGLTGMEILFSHMVTQFVVTLINTTLHLTFGFPLLGLEIYGSFFLVFILGLLAGVCGMCYGYTVSCACDTDRTASHIAMGSFLPLINLCGVLWPIEGMHKGLKVLSAVLPFTRSTASLRYILARGWGLEKSEVYEGFIAILIWIFVFFTASILLIKLKKG